MALRLKSPQARMYLIAAAVVCAVLALFVWAPGFLTTLETKVYDLHFTLRGARHPGGEVVIVAADEKSLATLGRWPWPRSILADVVTKLSDAGAKVIALDILLSEPQVEGELRAAEQLAARFKALGLSAQAGVGPALHSELEALTKRASHGATASHARASSAAMPAAYARSYARAARAIRGNCQIKSVFSPTR